MTVLRPERFLRSICFNFFLSPLPEDESPERDENSKFWLPKQKTKAFLSTFGKFLNEKKWKLRGHRSSKIMLFVLIPLNVEQKILREFSKTKDNSRKDAVERKICLFTIHLAATVLGLARPQETKLLGFFWKPFAHKTKKQKFFVIFWVWECVDLLNRLWNR